MTSVRARFAAFSCAGLLAAPRIAQACSVCSAGREDETQTAFLITTLFLSVLPLAMFAGLGLWFWRQARLRQPPQTQTQEQERARSAAHPAPS